MKNIVLALSVAIAFGLYSCGNESESIDLNDDLQLVKKEVASDREALAEEMAEENSNVNPNILIDKWWIADEKHGGSDQFFRKDGAYDTDFGKLGTWEWVEEGKVLKIHDNGQEVIYNIIELSESKFRFKMKDFIYTYYPKQVE